MAQIGAIFHQTLRGMTSLVFGQSRQRICGWRAVGALCFSAFALTSAHAHSIEQALAAFYLNNPSLRAAQLQVSSQNEATNQISGAALPQVSLNVSPGTSRSYAYSGANGFAGPINDANLGVGLTVSQAIDLSGSIGAQAVSADLSNKNFWVNYYAQEQSLILQAVGIYMDAITSGANVSVSQGAVSLLSSQYDASQARFDAGLGTSTDIATINASLQGARAQLASASGVHAIAQANFVQIFGFEPHSLQFPQYIPGLPHSMHHAISTAMENSPALRLARSNLEIAELNIIAAQASNGPSMNVNASANHSYDLWNNSNDHSTNLSLGANISMPLYQGGAGVSRVRQAEIDRDAARANLQAQEAQTRAEVIAAWQNLQSAEASLNSTVAQVEASEAALRGARAEEEVGTRTFLDTLSAENNLTEAQVLLVTSRAQVVLAGYSLLNSMGVLTAEALRLPTSGRYFRPSEDFGQRSIDNLATAIYLGRGLDRPTGTPDFFQWLFSDSTSTAQPVQMARTGTPATAYPNGK